MLPEIVVFAALLTYVVILALLFAYGLDFLILTFVALRTTHARPPRAFEEPDQRAVG